MRAQRFFPAIPFLVAALGALELTSTAPPDDETIFVDGFDGPPAP
jgi:hypothetical protein